MEVVLGVAAEVVVDDEGSLPGQFKTIVQEVKIDRKSIADALKSGQQIPGARLERGTSLRIK